MSIECQYEFNNKMPQPHKFNTNTFAHELRVRLRQRSNAMQCLVKTVYLTLLTQIKSSVPRAP